MFKTVLIFIVATALAAARPSERSSRVLGGRNVGLGELPFQVSLQFWGTTFHFAGGSLLNNRWVVTTAHGVVGRPQNSINIVLGIVRLDSGFTNRQSNEIRIHPLFNSATRVNDIATVRSSTNIVFTASIAPIALAIPFVDNGLVAHVSGWGAVNPEKTNEPMALQKVFVTSGPCVNTDFMTFSPQQHFCAGTAEEEPTVGICTSDIGGPLVNNNLLIGIPFYHDPRECGRYLDGYLRISFYRSWIMGNIPL